MNIVSPYLSSFIQLWLREFGDGATCRNVEANALYNRDELHLNYSIHKSGHTKTRTVETVFLYNINVYSLHSSFHRLQGCQAGHGLGNLK